MKFTKVLFLSFGIAAMFAACGSNDDSPVGKWESATPESITKSIDGAVAASKTTTLDFSAPKENGEGDVVLTSNYDVTVPFVTDSATNSSNYQVTATIKGTWTKEGDSHDDYLLSFDKNSLSVNGTNAPELGGVTDEFINSLNKYASIEDVEVSNNGTRLSFESGKPEVKFNFVKASK